jgi:hypothetical protein
LLEYLTAEHFNVPQAHQWPCTGKLDSTIATEPIADAKVNLSRSQSP